MKKHIMVAMLVGAFCLGTMIGKVGADDIFGQVTNSEMNSNPLPETIPAAIPLVKHDVKPIVKSPARDVPRHTLDDIVFKISRAKANLEEQDNIKFTKAIEYLQLALKELKQSRE